MSSNLSERFPGLPADVLAMAEDHKSSMDKTVEATKRELGRKMLQTSSQVVTHVSPGERGQPVQARVLREITDAEGNTFYTDQPLSPEDTIKQRDLVVAQASQWNQLPPIEKEQLLSSLDAGTITMSTTPYGEYLHSQQLGEEYAAALDR